MSLKLKALGLGVLALVAMSAITVVNAAAEGKGHFVSESEKTTIVGTEAGTHRLHLVQDVANPEGEIGCKVATYHGTASTSTISALEVTPTYAECGTTPNVNIPITTNGCTYIFTTNVGGTNGTAHLNCPSGKAIEIHHPNCTITVADEHGTPTTPTNQNISGLHYTTTTENNKHAILLDVNVTFNSQYHGGLCIFLGTNQSGVLRGKVTVRGVDTPTGLPTGITAT